MTMEEAGKFILTIHQRGMDEDRKNSILEQHLYLRQPGYGTSYYWKIFGRTGLGRYARKLKREPS
jgi:hypothetical protein